MKTDVITVYNGDGSIALALNEADAVSAYKHLPRRDALHLRLLTEEMMGLMRSITGETEGNFWIEDEDGVFELHLRVNTRMNFNKRKQLLETATSGKNEAAHGIMGKLRDIFYQGADEDVLPYVNPMFIDGIADYSTAPLVDCEWTLSRYRENLNSMRAKDDAAAEAWDELEKSVVAHVADDVKVSIIGDRVEMIISKAF